MLRRVKAADLAVLGAVFFLVAAPCAAQPVPSRSETRAERAERLTRRSFELQRKNPEYYHGMSREGARQNAIRDAIAEEAYQQKRVKTLEQKREQYRRRGVEQLPASWDPDKSDAENERIWRRDHQRYRDEISRKANAYDRRMELERQQEREAKRRDENRRARQIELDNRRYKVIPMDEQHRLMERESARQRLQRETMQRQQMQMQQQLQRQQLMQRQPVMTPGIAPATAVSPSAPAPVRPVQTTPTTPMKPLDPYLLRCQQIRC